MHLNYPELVLTYPAHLVSSVKMYLGKVRYSRTTPTSGYRTVKLSLLCLLPFLEPRS